MISVRLKKFLDDNMVGFDVVQHDPAFTAQELAARMHVPGRELVKVVVVKLNGAFALVALPAHRRIDLRALARMVGVRKCLIATESEFEELFPDCEVGAMPPFGVLYNLPTYVDKEVTWNEVMVINAGTHSEAIRVRYGDLKRLVRPRVGNFAVPPPIESAARRASAKKRKAMRKKKAKKKVKKKAKKKVRKKVKRKKKKVTKRKKTRRKKAVKRKGRKKKAARRKTKKKSRRKPPARRKKKASRKKVGRKRKRR